MISSTAPDVVFPAVIVLGNERIVAYELLADITRSWQRRRTTAGVFDKCYRLAWEVQTEVG